jgi:phytoene dehydrogenase-like protein
LPDRRFPLPANSAEKGEILSEVFPDQQDALIELFEFIQNHGPRLDPILGGQLEIPAEGFRGRRAWNRALNEHDVNSIPVLDEKLISNSAVRGLISALLGIAGQDVTDTSLSTPSAIRALWHLCHGITDLQGGRQGFDQLVTEKLLTIGGTVEDRRVASELEVRRGKARAVFTEDGARFGADMVVIAGGEPMLSLLWNEAPRPEAMPGRTYRIPVERNQRPEGLMDPCGWIPEPDANACSVRVHEDRIELTLQNGAGLPNLESLMPFAGAQFGDPLDIALPTNERVDDLGLFHHPIRTVLKNALFVGSWVMPGLGIETDCATAWHAARLVERGGPGRWRPGARV